MNKKIAIIGAGHMGQGIAQGLLRKKIFRKDQIILTNSKTKNNKKVVEKADIVILAVKPQKLEEVLLEIRDSVRKDQLLISIVAGVTITSIQEVLILTFSQRKKETLALWEREKGEGGYSIVRVMPNLAAQVGKSMSVWFANKNVSNDQRKIIVEILSAIGAQTEVENEDDINKATAISGSGPAYFFYLVEQLENAAIALGFSQETAEKLARQTFLGAAEVLKNSEKSAKELRDAVTSKGGTTEAAIAVFQKEKLSLIIKEGVFSAFKRAKKLGSK